MDTQAFPFNALPGPGPDPLAEAKGLVADVRQMLGVARGLVAAGRQVDMAGLDRAVGLLCAKSLDLAAEQGRAIRQHLLLLLGELDALTAAMRSGA